MVSYGVVVLSHRRPENMLRVVEAIRAQRPEPVAVYVWHNVPSIDPVENAVNVFAAANFGCPARHAFGLLVPADVVVFADDDVLLTARDVCSRLAFAAGEAFPGAVVGPEGRRCLRVSDTMYWGEDSARVAHADLPVSIVKGKLHAAQRSALRHAFARRLPPAVRGEDDIALCAEVQIATDRPARVISGLRGKYRNLSDDKGNDHRPDHFARRNAACQHLASVGWEPMAWKR